MVKNEDDAEFIVPELRYHELQERIKKSQVRITELEAEIGRLNSEYDNLNVKYEALELEKQVLVERTTAASKTSAEVEGTFVDLTENDDDDDELFQLKAENVTLEHEKKKAENDAQVWKQMYHELKSSLGISFEDGTTHAILGSNLQRQYKSIIGEHRCGGLDNKKARRSLFIEQVRNPIGKMSPSTPINRKSSCPGIINLDDSDEEPEAEMDEQKPKLCTLATTENEKSPECCLEDDMDVGLGTTPRATTSKRKRAANMVTSDSDDDESDDEDNIPLCKWKAKRLSKVTSDANGLSKTVLPLESGDDDKKDSVIPHTRRLKRMSQCEQRLDDAEHESNGSRYEAGVEEIESEEDCSESSGDSMKEFIVDTCSDVSDGEDASDSSEEADCNLEMHGILSRLGRSKDHKFKWELEGDMLADFGKDAELCMRAVCVLYRQQTSDEQVSKEALYLNGRGFSKFDAYRGTEMGRFLSGGEPCSDMIKSVEELEAHDSKGVDKCRELAFKYAKQLFHIYHNQEDPFFSPSAHNNK
ncbi:hypothetical protein LINGRAHAP2_LOCUS22274 [Linum grandiflorum]